MASSDSSNNQAPVRVGVIGIGGWGFNHARTLRDLGHLVAVADHTLESTQVVAEKLDCKAMTAQDLIASEIIDAVVLALPPESHVEFALKVMSAGKHVFVEKPMSLDLLGAKAICAKATETGLTAMTGHILRFHTAYMALEKLVNSGALGKIKYIYSTRLGLGKFFSKMDSFWDFAPHELSILLALTGERPSDIKYVGTSVLDDKVDYAHIHADFPSGIHSHTFVSRLAPHRERKFSVVGEKAMTVLDDIEPWERKLAVYNHKVDMQDGVISVENAEPEYIETLPNMALDDELQHFVSAIRTGKTPISSVFEGLEVLRTVDQAERRPL